MNGISTGEVVDAVVENEMTESFERMSETEKEHVLMQCKDAASTEEAELIAKGVRHNSAMDMVEAMANSDIGNSIENSGVR